MKAWVSLVMMILEGFGMNMNIMRKIIRLKRVVFRNKNIDTKDELVEIIMGSSTVYPFIGLHYHKDKLLLEAEIKEDEYGRYLLNCKKKIIIHNKTGITKIKGNTIHIYSKRKIPNTFVDYSFKTKIREIREIGRLEARDQYGIIRRFLNRN